MMPTLIDLRCFVAAATSTSFASAARGVGLAPTSLSGHLRALEDTLECDLFVKRGRKKILTPEGERLLPAARRVVDGALALKALAWDDDVKDPFTLTIGTRFELGLSWLVPLLSTLEREHPERTLHLAFGDTADLLDRTARGNVDATVTSARLSGSASGQRLRTTALHHEAYVFVAARRLVARRPLRGPSDAAEHTLIDAAGDLPLFRYLLDGVAGGSTSKPAEAWPFREVLSYGAISAIRARVLQGRGVAVLPRYLVAEDLRRRRLVILCPRRRPVSDVFRLVWREGHPREVELRALAERMAREPLR